MVIFCSCQLNRMSETDVVFQGETKTDAQGDNTRMAGFVGAADAGDASASQPMCAFSGITAMIVAGVLVII